MNEVRMLTSRQMFFSLVWLLVCVVLHFAPPAQGQTYVTTPQNTTINIGKGATFACVVAPGNSTMNSINFTASLPQNSYVLQCPGKNIKFPSMSLYGNCDTSNGQLSATWQISNVDTDVNNTAFTCAASGLNTATGYLWLTGTSKYFLMLFGCVLGGFFGILIVFGITYVSLKKSERLQECFKGKPEDDVMGGGETETIRE